MWWGGVCEEIDASWVAENKVVCIVWQVYVGRSTPLGKERIRLYVLCVKEGWECRDRLS